MNHKIEKQIHKIRRHTKKKQITRKSTNTNKKLFTKIVKIKLCDKNVSELICSNTGGFPGGGPGGFPGGGPGGFAGALESPKLRILGQKPFAQARRPR